MSRRQYDDDDGRTVAPMNVDGMPWYVPKDKARPDGSGQDPLSRSLTRAAVGGVLKAALLVAAVFAGAYLLFILFCTNVWFR